MWASLVVHGFWCALSLELVGQRRLNQGRRADTSGLFKTKLYPNYPETAMTTRKRLLAAFAGTMLACSVIGEGQTTEQRISVVTLGVKSLATSRRFYVQGLGWKPVYRVRKSFSFRPAAWCCSVPPRQARGGFSGESRHIRTRPHRSRAQCSRQERN